MPDNVSDGLRVAIYARVSSEEQREGQTIDSQIAELERYAREKQWTLVTTYKDEGWSGSLLARPELDRLRDDASKRKFDIVLLNDVDRLARDVTHLGIIKRDLERNGIQVIFRKLPAEKSPTYNLMVNILGSFAEFEREMISDRMRRGRRHKVEVRQQFIGTRPAYGYHYVLKDRVARKDGYLEIVPAEAAVVRQMYSWVSEEGLSIHKVMKRLNEAKALARKGNPWAKSSVTRILRSEIYAGVWYYNKLYSCEPTKPVLIKKYKHSLKSSTRLRAREEWIPVVLPLELRIIEREQWLKVQRQIDSNIVFSLRNTRHLYLLRGLISCGGCSAAYVGDPGKGKFCYRCSKRCKMFPSIIEHTLDEAVWSAVEKAVLNPTIIVEQVAKHKEREEENGHQWQSEYIEVEKLLNKLKKEESRILEAYRLSILSPAQLGQELQKINARKSALENRKAHLNENTQSLKSSNVKATILDYCKRAAQRLKHFTFEERQRFLRLIVNKIIYEGQQVRIKGIIPLSKDGIDSSNSLFLNTGEQILESSGGFATTTNYHDGHNSDGSGGIATTTMYHDGHNSVLIYPSKQLVSRGEDYLDYASFELTKSLPEPPFSILSEQGLALIRRLKEELVDSTLKELSDRVEQEIGVKVNISHIGRALKRLNLSRIKIGPRAK
ncbi:MAG: hypothetical protein AUG51_02830 [Acidobacteria bacterium 13_1_20CM_3_53_8]|nr:MAG: hypothetical protein AUG51_02830 [Acidobacteria bacterium 13_1_20CM_3_53_8]